MIMSNIQFIQINIRYFAFKVEDTYYLLDRKPVNLLCYFFFPLNWLFKQKLYVITENDFQQLITKKQSAGNFVISTSLSGGLTVLLTMIIRESGLVESLETNFSVQTNLILFALILFIALFLVELFYYLIKRSLRSKINFKNMGIIYNKLRPTSFSQSLIKGTFLYLLFLMLTISTILTFVYYGNFFFLCSSLLFLCIMFIGTTMSYNTQVTYKIV